MGKHFVLVHGAWHGGWVWDGVLTTLREHGHTGEAPTMPGHNPGDNRAGLTMANYKDDLSLPPGGYQAMAQRLGEHRYFEMVGSHETLFINSRALALKLLEIAGS